MNSLALLRRYLILAAAEDSEYVLFGSAVLVLNGISTGRPLGDIDVFVSKRVWGELLTNATGARWETPRAADPPFLVLPNPGEPNVHAFFDWTDRDESWMRPERCFEVAEKVNGWMCIPLTEVRRHKAGAGTDSEKHAHDLRVIDAHLATS